MAMLGSAQNMEEKPQDAFALACRLYRDGAFAAAYALFSAADDQSIAVGVNLGLCLMQAGAWQEALPRLQGSLSALRGAQQRRAAVPVNKVEAALHKLQAQGTAYLQPMERTLPMVAPAYAQECLLRLLVDAYAAAGLWQQVRIAADALAGKGYANVEKALQQAGRSTAE